VTDENKKNIKTMSEGLPADAGKPSQKTNALPIFIGVMLVITITGFYFLFQVFSKPNDFAFRHFSVSKKPSEHMLPVINSNVHFKTEYENRMLIKNPENTLSVPDVYPGLPSAEQMYQLNRDFFHVLSKYENRPAAKKFLNEVGEKFVFMKDLNEENSQDFLANFSNMFKSKEFYPILLKYSKNKDFVKLLMEFSKDPELQVLLERMRPIAESVQAIYNGAPIINENTGAPMANPYSATKN
jgi:hypothetical protein